MQKKDETEKVVGLVGESMSQEVAEGRGDLDLNPRLGYAVDLL